MNPSPEQTHFRTCNLCEAMCGLEIKVQGDEVLSIRGDKDDPFSKGHICPKATALADIYHDPDRLKQPVRRTAVGWEQISWDEAFDEVVSHIQRIQAAHGRNAVGIYLGNPNVHNMDAIIYNPPFIRSLRTRNRFSATSVDQLPHHVAAYFMFGHQLLLPVPDVDRTQFMLILGANPVASNGSLMTAPGIANRLKKLQKRGGQLVVVDPRRTETAVLANHHLFIKPGTDALFLLALLHIVLAEGLANPGPLAEMAEGLTTLAELVSDYAPEVVAAATGIDAEQIRQVAHDFAQAETAVCYGRMGVSTQRFGGLCQWLINALNFVTGNLDQTGGAMFTNPAIDVVSLMSLSNMAGRFGKYQTRVRQLPDFSGEYPVSALAEEILTPGEGQIRGMVTVAGNPVLSTPNGRQLDEAFAQLDFMVAIDIYINETTRHANIILPPTTGLETEQYDLVFHVLAVRNTVKFSPALFEAAVDKRSHWQIVTELRNRLEGTTTVDRQSFAGKFDFQKRLSPQKILDLGLRFGPYGAHGVNRGNLGAEGLTLNQLKREPHGRDLGPLQPMLKQRLALTGGKIKLAPAELVADLARLYDTYLKGNNENDYGRYDLTLIGRRQLRSNNSWMHNVERLVKGKERCTLLMNAQDAASRDLVAGQQVTICSRVGQVTLPLEISEALMTGVVSIPHGWGHGRQNTQLRIANEHPGASINDLTDEHFLDALTGNAALNGVPVYVTV